jgi:subtilisin family serine protease
VLAPGTKIFSSVPTNRFADKNGTSMAAPHVAGAIALLRSKNPFATVSEIETALETTGLGVTDQRSGGTITKPRIRVFEAAERLPKSTISVSAQGALSFTPDLRGRYQPASVRLEVRMTGTAAATGWHIEGVPTWLSVTGASTITNGGLVILTVSPTAQAANVARDTTATLKFVNDGNRSQSPVQIPVSIKAANMNI